MILEDNSQPCVFSKVPLENGKSYDSWHKMQNNIAFAFHKQTPPSVNIGPSADFRTNTALQTCHGSLLFQIMRAGVWAHLPQNTSWSVCVKKVEKNRTPSLRLRFCCCAPIDLFFFFVPSVVCFRSHLGNLSDFPFLRWRDSSLCDCAQRAKLLH